MIQEIAAHERASLGEAADAVIWAMLFYVLFEVEMSGPDGLDGALWPPCVRAALEEDVDPLEMELQTGCD